MKKPLFMFCQKIIDETGTTYRLEFSDEDFADLIGSFHQKITTLERKVRALENTESDLASEG
jgi:hypothetical protein